MTYTISCIFFFFISFDKYLKYTSTNSIFSLLNLIRRWFRYTKPCIQNTALPSWFPYTTISAFSQPLFSPSTQPLDLTQRYSQVCRKTCQKHPSLRYPNTTTFYWCFHGVCIVRHSRDTVNYWPFRTIFQRQSSCFLAKSSVWSAWRHTCLSGESESCICSPHHT